MGENIGDLGGVEVSLEAYKMSLNGAEAPVIDGFTGIQRFFLGWGQVWRSKYRDEALRNQVLSDPHSPARYRVNGVVPNVDDWYTAFSIPADAKMFIAPEKRVKIW
jgi:putative endopeptidase